MDGYDVLGVIVVEGSIAVTSEGLGRLASDARVLIVDTVSIVAQQLAPSIGGTAEDRPGTLDVEIPTPYWNLDWTPAD